MHAAVMDLRNRRLVLLLSGLLAVAGLLGLPTPAAYAAGSTPATATPIIAMPFSDNEYGGWTYQPPATGSANAKVSDSCNAGGSIYRVRWYSYAPSAATTVLAEGRMIFRIGRYPFGVGSGVAVLDSNLGVIDCRLGTELASAGPVKVASGAKVYVVQFVTETPADDDCSSIQCYETVETLSLQQVGPVPTNDEVPNATPVTAIPFTASVDPTTATPGAGGSHPYDEDCGSGSYVDEITHTVYWTLTPTTTGPLKATVTDPYQLFYGELSGDNATLTPVNCTSDDGVIKPAVLQAGKTYLLEAGIPYNYTYYSYPGAGEGRPLTLSITSGPTLAKPDLVVTGVSASPASPKAGSPVAFRATIKNQGNAPTPAGVAHGVAFKVDGVTKTWSDTFNASLAPGKSVTLTTNGGVAGAPTWPAAAGEHTVLATVDDINRIRGESNESNNTRSTKLSVAAQTARPDLVVTGLSWTPTDPAAGAAVTFKATVKNQGAAATPAGVVHGVVFKVDGVTKTWSATSKAALAPGASTVLTANTGTAGKATWPATSGPHTLLAVVDDVNRIPNESDEANNALSVPLNIGPTPSRPDLVVTGVSWSPASVAAGSPVRFSATVQNLGTRSTPAGTVVGVSFRPNGQGSGATYSDTRTSTIRPGETVTLTANGGGSSGTWKPPAGSTPVVAVVDDINRLVETNEANNTLSTTFTTS